MPLTVTSTCCLCGAEGTSQEVDIESIQLRPDAGWAMLRVEMAEAVLPKNMEGVASALDDISNNPAYGIMAAQLQSMARPFSTNMLICAACQDGGPLWTKVRERLKAAVEKEVQNAPPAFPAAVLSFPGSPVLRPVAEPCSECGDLTNYECVDCRHDKKPIWRICQRKECQEKHTKLWHDDVMAACSACGEQTTFMCSDCLIERETDVAVCQVEACQKAHELAFHPAPPLL